jgi:hypothetical protein
MKGKERRRLEGEESEESVENDEPEEETLTPSRIDVAAEQRRDPCLNLYVELEKGLLPEKESQARQVVLEAQRMWLDKDGRLFRTWWPQRDGVHGSTRQQLFIPESLRDEVSRGAHDDLLGGHLGRERTYMRNRILVVVDV